MADHAGFALSAGTAMSGFAVSLLASPSCLASRMPSTSGERASGASPEQLPINRICCSASSTRSWLSCAKALAGASPPKNWPSSTTRAPHGAYSLRWKSPQRTRGRGIRGPSWTQPLGATCARRSTTPAGGSSLRIASALVLRTGGAADDYTVLFDRDLDWAMPGPMLSVGRVVLDRGVEP